jgi:hypothetical protein
MNQQYKKYINQVYLNHVFCHNKKSDLNSNLLNTNFYYYGYGRNALYFALKNAKVNEDDFVLLPSFICRDLLSAINSIGAKPIYYDVDESLSPLQNLNTMPKCKVVIAVNYFGFPQNLIPFKEYCLKNESILIEDNAHGFLSRDLDGKLLGTRADLGIFSFRKTIFIEYGSGLFIKNINNLNLDEYIIQPVKKVSFSFYTKLIIKKIFPLIKISGIRFLTKIIRHMRKIRTGHDFPQSQLDAESILPKKYAPPFGLKKNIEKIDFKYESKRRRDLYNWLNNKIIDFGGIPVFKELPEKCVPYGFPFYTPDALIEQIENQLLLIGLESFSWPDLPDQIYNSAPKFYHSLRCVRFLW